MQKTKTIVTISFLPFIIETMQGGRISNTFLSISPETRGTLNLLPPFDVLEG
jgi:hypothetical protein